MKTVSRLFVAIVALCASTTFVSCKDKIITPDKLPVAAQNFIKEYFPENAISYAKKDVEISGTTYEVKDFRTEQRLTSRARENGTRSIARDWQFPVHLCPPLSLTTFRPVFRARLLSR